MTPEPVREKENREVRLVMRWRTKKAKMPIHPSRNGSTMLDADANPNLNTTLAVLAPPDLIASHVGKREVLSSSGKDSALRDK